jgi:PKD repeat protein
MKRKAFAGMMILLGFLLFLVTVGAAPAPDALAARAGTTRYVKPGGSGDCSSWAQACELQRALSDAVSGDEIWVAAGTYKPTAGSDRAISFALKSGVGVYGGFAGTETSREERDWAARQTILSGDIGTPSKDDNSYRVVTGSGTDASAVLDGFTITAGNAIGPGSLERGGGMYLSNGSPTIRHVIFKDNAARDGGGMYNSNSSPTLTGCAFMSNTASEYGGGMYNSNSSSPTLITVTFSSNSATSGGGMYNVASSPTLTASIFSGNNSSGHGGGMTNQSSSPTLIECTFSHNGADVGGGMRNYPNSNPTLITVTFSANTANHGGGMYNHTASSPRLTGCTFSGNSASDEGGGMANHAGSNPVLTSTQFITNTAVYGGGMYNNDSSNPRLTDCTFSGNSASDKGGGMANHAGSSPVLTSTQFITNTAVVGGGMYNEDSSSPSLTDCTFSGNSASDEGGGMANHAGSNPVLTGTRFINNTATVLGGGMYNHDSSSPMLTDVEFSGNRAWEGGGMYNFSETYPRGSPTLISVTFSDNAADHNGGGMSNAYDNPVLTDTQFIANTADHNGGGMFNSTGSPVLTDTQFITNTATLYGGGMYNDYNATLTDVEFSGNTAVVGGGMYNTLARPTLTGCAFIANTADYGGGMSNAHSSPTLITVTFIDNQATASGGGMRNYERSSARLTGCTFSRNRASDKGGAMYNTDSSPVLTDTQFISNTATIGGGIYNGGGFYNDPGIVAGTNVTVTSNKATNGGGIYNDAGIVAGTNVTVTSNKATNGGGIYNRGSSTVDNLVIVTNTATNGGGICNTQEDGGSPTLTNLILRGNTAENGGAIYNDGGNPGLSSVDISNNTAAKGGGMYNKSSKPDAKRMTFTDNEATASGGGMYNEASAPRLVNASFISNTATFGGGGMYNKDCTLAVGVPQLVNTLFNNNAATGTTGNEGYGGGMYNEGSSPELVNVTFGNNTATQCGGGIADFKSALNPSTPHLDNCVLWANTSASGTPEEDQIYNHVDGGQAIVGSTCTVEGSQPQASPFVDADGADDIPGTADDDLRLAHTSEAIDGGDETLPLLVDILDLDGDENTTEELPFDLDGNVRRYADENLDGQPDPLGAPYSDRRVDQGAYEAGCYAWHMHYGADWLAEGQKYRLNFHYEIDNPSTVTISDTLASYAAERAAGNLDKARTAYTLALDCATTVTETNDALAGLLKVTWEQATGAMLEGNEEMVKALDLTDGEGMAMEISYLETAIDKYSEATNGYLLPLTGEHQAEFLAAMGISRTHEITYTTVITQVDVQRLAAASAKKSQATLELAERYFRRYRNGDRALAEETLRQGKAEATVELALLEEIWAGVVEDVNYHALERNMSDMDRLLGFLVGGKNPLGYSPEWVPIHYNPSESAVYPNNYLKVNALAKEKLGGAQDVIDVAAAESEKVHDQYTVMQQRYAEIEEEYDHELEQMCGAHGEQPDLDRCGGGTIEVQISAVEQAQLRLGRVLEEMNVLSKRIQYEVEARAKAAGIYEATAELINPDTSEKYSSMVEQEQEISTGWKVFKGVAGILTGMTGGGKAGGVFGKKGAIAGGVFGALGPAMDMVAGLVGPEEGPPKEEKLLEFQAWQNAQMVICDGQIADLEFEKRIKELYLEYGLLDIDYAIALENLHQELLRLDGMKTRVEYLLAEKDRAMAFSTLLYRDPGHRVLRDYYMELAQDSYDTALDYTFRAGRALEYEANLTSAELDSPDPDEMFGIRNIVTLITARADTKTAYDTWSADKNPQPKTTIVRLSRALNYEDTYIDGQLVTAEEQFNAYVVRNPDNRIIEPTGEESLRFTFGTSVHMGNPFFDYCLFNDRIESVRVRVRGADLGLENPEDGVTVRLGWGDVGCADTDCGTTFIRSEKAWFTGDGYGNWLDDLRAYKIQPKLATIQAAAGDAAWPEDPNTDLALRSVACPYWVFKIPGNVAGNESLNLDSVDEIELIITHEAYSLQAPMCVAASSLRLAPSREYRPMERVLDPMSSPLLVALAEDRSGTTQDGATSLSGLYAGTVAITSPQYMPAVDMNLVLTATGSSLTGYLDATQSLHVPVVDEATGHGPAVSGSWSGAGFDLQSEVFTTTLSSGLLVTRQVILHSGVISNSGEYLTGVYSETLGGLTPEPMVIVGDVELWRLPAAVGPTASFRAFPMIGPVALTVTFSDFSAGDPTAWAWDFGDGGTSTEQNPTHTYTAIGTYTVTLTVSNTLGADTVVMPSLITVVQPQAPEARFSADPISGPAPLRVTFTDQSSNYPTAWFWDFGDGGTSTEQSPVHVYNTAGSFSVSLTVSNTLGSDTLTKPSCIVVVEPMAPEAQFSADPTSGIVPLTVIFTDQSSNYPTTWLWDFGDGGTSTQQHPIHTYHTPSSFTVTLTVSNTVGSDTLSVPGYITVEEGQRIYLPLVVRRAP